MRRKSSMIRCSSLGVLAACAAGLIVPIAARADEFVDRVNKGLNTETISDSKRSDLVILPLLAKMEVPPEPFTTQWKAAIIPANLPEFENAAKWAQGATQTALFDALKKVTKEEDFRKAFVYNQPYGVDAVAAQQELVAAGLYTELPDGLLILAQFGHLEKLEHLGILVHVEATRLAAEGKPEDALKLLRTWLLFTRQFADRPFIDEAKWALESMKLGVERISDIVYQDFRAKEHKLTAQSIKDFLKSMQLQGSYFDLERMTYPLADMVAQGQLVELTIEKNGDPKPGEFASVLSKVDTKDDPLRRFSSAAYWERLRGSHQDYEHVTKMSTGLFEDLRKRWALNPNNASLRSQSDYERYVANGDPYAMLRLNTKNTLDLFDIRRAIRIEWGGMRAGLAVYGYQLQFNTIPPAAAAADRDFLGGDGPKDPYRGDLFPLMFFVPQRDTPIKDKPYEMKIFPGGDLPNFTYPIGKDQYVFYAVGRDRKPNGATVIAQDQAGVKADYLLWPPVISLVRQRLAEIDQLISGPPPAPVAPLTETKPAADEDKPEPDTESGTDNPAP